MLPVSYQNDLIEAGCDEVGRGCLAGPVVAAAVILPSDFKHPDLNDSKKLSARKREELREVILKEAVAWEIKEVSPQEIDIINILNASFKAMNMAVASLYPTPEFLAIDGHMFRTELSIPYTCVIRGDGRYANIAAASIIAKTYRDDLMRRMDRVYSGYGWSSNMGYATAGHRKAVMELGITEFHRKSFCTFLTHPRLF